MRIYLSLYIHICYTHIYIYTYIIMLHKLLTFLYNSECTKHIRSTSIIESISMLCALLLGGFEVRGLRTGFGVLKAMVAVLLLGTRSCIYIYISLSIYIYIYTYIYTSTKYYVVVV